MRITESKLRSTIRKILVETIPAADFGRKKPYSSKFSNEDAEKLVARFGRFLDNQEDLDNISFENVTVGREPASKKYPNEYIEMDVLVYERESERAPFYGFIPGKLFKGTKRLSNVRNERKIDRVGLSATRYNVYLYLHNYGLASDAERDEIYRELEQWLDANENKQYSREEFGIPEVTQRRRDPKTGFYDIF